MNTTVTSQEEIVNISKLLVHDQGMSSFSMRMIAAQCGIAVGSLYNYFPSKAKLLSATVESIWEEIFKPLKHTAQFDSFIDCVLCMFETIRNGY